MEELTKSDKIKVKILRILSDFKDHTPNEIALTLNTNQNTVLSNCVFLKLIGILEIEIKKTARTNYFIKLKKEFQSKSIDDIIDRVKSLK